MSEKKEIFYMNGEETVAEFFQYFHIILPIIKEGSTFHFTIKDKANCTLDEIYFEKGMPEITVDEEAYDWYIDKIYHTKKDNDFTYEIEVY